MGNGDEFSALAVGAGLLGLGYLAWREHEKRQNFRTQLNESVRPFGLAVTAADLGRSAGNRPVWQVTVRHQLLGVYALTATYPAGTDAYSETTRSNLTKRLLGFFNAGSGYALAQ